jgi:hypothetical protein
MDQILNIDCSYKMHHKLLCPHCEVHDHHIAYLSDVRENILNGPNSTVFLIILFMLFIQNAFKLKFQISSFKTCLTYVYTWFKYQRIGEIDLICILTINTGISLIRIHCVCCFFNELHIYTRDDDDDDDDKDDDNDADDDGPDMDFIFSSIWKWYIMLQ